jgi:hypothetical protein
MVPSALAKKDAKADVSMPGTGTWTPIRYTMSKANVNIMRFFSSGILKTFWNPLPIIA